MIVVIATIELGEGAIKQVHVPVETNITKLPPTKKEKETIIKTIEEKEQGKVLSIDSITWSE